MNTLESNEMTQEECRLMDIDYIQPKVEGGIKKMATLKEEAQAYVPPTTKNIAELQKIPVSLELKDGEGKDKDNEVYQYKYAMVGGEKYRVPGSVLGGIKTLLKIRPNLEFVQVLKSGSGMNTTYQVIPYTDPIQQPAPITTAEAIQQPAPITTAEAIQQPPQ